MNNTLKKIWNITSTVLVVLIVLCAVFLMGSRIMGYHVYTVLSGSMEPEYMVGDLLYVKHVDSRDFSDIKDKAELEKAKQEKIDKILSLIEDGSLKVKDPITFMLNETTVATHRIVEIDTENYKFITQGDANETTEEVHFLNLVGEVSFSIPKLGYVSDFIQNPPGMYITIAIGAVLILAVFLPDMIGKKKKEEENPELVAVQSEVKAANEENERLKAEVERLRAEAHYSSGELAQISADKEGKKSE